MKKPFMLMILDGFGLSSKTTGNAIAAASLPNINEIFKKYPFTTLKASGLAVGLPEGQMGNSEVGHLNIGAGRVVYQELTRISKAIDDGIFNGNTALLSAINHAGSCKTLHIMGLLSDGGVHSHIDHIKAVIRLFRFSGRKAHICTLFHGRTRCSSYFGDRIYERPVGFRSRICGGFSRRCIGKILRYGQG